MTTPIQRINPATWKKKLTKSFSYDIIEEIDESFSHDMCLHGSQEKNELEIDSLKVI